jgi:hypothetical protein
MEHIQRYRAKIYSFTIEKYSKIEENFGENFREIVKIPKFRENFPRKFSRKFPENFQKIVVFFKMKYNATAQKSIFLFL